MTRPYSPRAFLRKVPNALLREFFARQRLLLDLDWDRLTETDVDPIHHAWLDLPDADQARTELAFRDVDALATAAGIRLLVEEGAFHAVALAPLLEPLGGLHHKAMFAYLHHPAVFRGAGVVHQAQSLSARYWNKRNHLPHTPPDLSEAALWRFRKALSFYYRQNEGRGEHCSVEVYVRGGRAHYFFAYPDDYADVYLGHGPDGRLVRRPQRPAFQVVFVFDPTAGALDLFAPGGRQVRADLQEIFGREVLGRDLGPELPRQHAYELNVLKAGSFAFPTDPGDGVAEVSVRRLRLSLIGHSQRRRLTLEGDPNGGPLDVYRMLDAWLPESVVPRSLVNITQATLHLRLNAHGANGRPRTLTIHLSYPDACDLKSRPEEFRLLGEKYLKRWGIDRE